MITEYIRYQIAEDRIEGFIEDYAKAAESLEKSPYCQGYDLTQCSEDKTLFVLRILWTSTEDHLQGFRKSKEFQSFFASIKPYLGNILEMKHYEFTRVKSA